MKKIIAASLFCSLFHFIGHSQLQISRVAQSTQTDKVTAINAETKPVAFRLTAFSLPALPANAAGNGTILNTSVKEFDLANNTKGSSFVAPENGVYHFDVRLNFSPGLTDLPNYLRFHLTLLKGNNVIEQTTLMNPQTQLTTKYTIAISTTVMLNKGDVITAAYNADANPNTPAVNATGLSFSGFKVADLQGGSMNGTIK